MYTAGTSKEYIRNDVFLYFKDCNNILTLPNLYFNLEEKLIEAGKNVECTERKKSIYREQIKIKPAKIKLYNKDVKNINVSKYDGIFLDLCGTFNDVCREILPQLNYNTKIVLTFLMARENKKLQERIDITNREETYLRLLNSYQINVDKYINYRDTTPMCVFFGTKF